MDLPGVPEFRQVILRQSYLNNRTIDHRIKLCKLFRELENVKSLLDTPQK